MYTIYTYIYIYRYIYTYIHNSIIRDMGSHFRDLDGPRNGMWVYVGPEGLGT